MPKGVFGTDHAFLPRSQILTFEEITRVAGIFAGLGVEKLRLTGREQLLRKHLEKLIALLAGVHEIQDITLTTNGSLLEQKARSLFEAGLRRITFSLDALDPRTFAGHPMDHLRCWGNKGVHPAHLRQQWGFTGANPPDCPEQLIRDARILPAQAHVARARAHPHRHHLPLPAHVLLHHHLGSVFGPRASRENPGALTEKISKSVSESGRTSPTTL